MATYTNVTSIHSGSVESGAVAELKQASSQFRLTRRGRIVFGALATVLVAGVLAVVAMFVAPGAVANSEGSEAEFSYVVAQPGDSLWSIAQDLDPAADTRDVIEEIAKLNQLHSAELQVGEAIAVPLRFADSARAFGAAEIGL